MIKMVEFLHRSEEYSHEEFVERWQGEHAEEFVDVGAGPRMIVEESVHLDQE